MKYRKWDPKIKMRIVLEGLEQGIPLVDLCQKYSIRQSTYYYWLKEFETKGYKVFESAKQSKKEQRLQDENNKLKQIIAELSIELKKTEFELKDLEGDDQ